MSRPLARLSTSAADFDQRLRELLAFDQDTDAAVQGTVREILAAVRTRGDAALLEYTNRFDQRALTSAAELEVHDLDRFRAQVPTDVLAALSAAAERIRDYHQRQRQVSWDTRTAMAPSWDSKSRRSIGRGFTCRAARRPIRPLC